MYRNFKVSIQGNRPQKSPLRDADVALRLVKRFSHATSASKNGAIATFCVVVN
ncbi:hypothetical protein ALQ86_200026 [Pseudomonas amygdali pv. eriobotryae]|uniref:Uncharacterized protein n=1 Tax=Pseudomonas amygdali pv. eriobotryae TaxID=129137 RepID=A0A3M3ADG3_PSEA0|nr:hypothetical protein ALQ86_200026 [Pseudomonas amygdali pv. eriobotryae]RMT42200.1 hypothetical protein ALP46_200284 [Pseudomonas amygdali pv. myricae]